MMAKNILKRFKWVNDISDASHKLTALLTPNRLVGYGTSSHQKHPKRRTFDPDVQCSGYSEYKQEQNKHERLHVIGRHSSYAKQDRPQQFALRCVESMSKDIRNAAIVCCCTKQPIKTHFFSAICCDQIRGKYDSKHP